MSLVAYDSEISDSDDGQDDQNESQNVRPSPTIVAEKSTPSVSANSSDNADGSLFKILPLPKKKNILNDVEEEEDEFLLKRETPTAEPKPKPVLPLKINERKPAKIAVPSLSSFNDDDDEEAQPRFKKSVNGSGLLSLLPQPKENMFMKKNNTTKMVPNILTRPAITKTVVRKPIKPVNNVKSKILTGYDSSEGDESEPENDKKGGDFFSLNSEPEPLPDIEVNVEEEINKYKKNNSVNTSLMSQTNIESEFVDNNYEQYEECEDTQEEEIDVEALRRLGSNRERKTCESMQFIDINQSEILPDPKEWLTKALTDDSMTSVPTLKRKGDEPTNQQKRKHQITYLAHKARAMEKELQNQWAQNRMTRKQTQSKYGF